MIVATLAACGGAAKGGDAPRSGKPSAYVRVNQVGYTSGDSKRARLLSPVAAPGSGFSVLDGGGKTVLHGHLGGDLGRWSKAFPHVYPIDFSSVRAGGTYSIAVSGAVQARSPLFAVASPAKLYAGLAANEVRFMRGQRDGPNVDRSILGRAPSHLADRAASVYVSPRYRGNRLLGGLRGAGGRADVLGGWMDAGDTLKYAETGSFAETLLLYAIRSRPSGFGDGLPAARNEARFGMDWLLALWRASPRRLIYQVGLGDGNDKTILGAHDTTWRLPQADDALRATPGSPARYVKYRPAFRDGPPAARTSPNLAGRMAAALALGAQVFAGDDPVYAKRCLDAARSILASARTRAVGRLVTAAPHSFYPEREWRDDMELGAAELALAEGRAPSARRDLGAAARWATAYATSPLNGTDTLNLYDVAALAHTELYTAMRGAGIGQVGGVSRSTLEQDLRGQLGLAGRIAARDPFSLGSRYRDDDTVSHALGLAVEARLLDGLSGSRRYEGFAETQRNFVLGDNAWGTSFVVGAGARFPDCLHHPVANLEGSLNGAAPLLLGAVVPGPVNAADLRGLALPKGFRVCPAGGGDPLARFSGFGARYEDSVVASPTNEPSLDIAALALLAFAQEASP